MSPSPTKSDDKQFLLLLPEILILLRVASVWNASRAVKYVCWNLWALFLHTLVILKIRIFPKVSLTFWRKLVIYFPLCCIFFVNAWQGIQSLACTLHYINWLYPRHLPIKPKLAVPIQDLINKNLYLVNFGLQKVKSVLPLFYHVYLQEWTDANLRWNSSEYGNVEDIRMPPSVLWKPDILMYNR